MRYAIIAAVVLWAGSAEAARHRYHYHHYWRYYDDYPIKTRTIRVVQQAPSRPCAIETPTISPLGWPDQWMRPRIFARWQL
jgi:hypothetical protein